MRFRTRLAQAERDRAREIYNRARTADPDDSADAEFDAWQAAAERYAALLLAEPDPRPRRPRRRRLP